MSVDHQAELVGAVFGDTEGARNAASSACGDLEIDVKDGMSSSLGASLLLGAVSGIVVVLGEALVGLVNGLQLTLFFHLAAPPAYLVLGLAVGGLAHASIRVASAVPGLRTRRFDSGRIAACLTIAALVFFHVFIVVNEFVLAHTPLTSIESMVSNATVGFLSAMFFLFLTVLTKKFSDSVRFAFLVSGLLPVSISVASIYRIFDRPMMPELRWSMTLVVALFVLIFFVYCGLYLLVNRSSRMTSEENPKNSVNLVLVTLLVALLLLVGGSAVPDGKFDLRRDLKTVANGRENVVLIVIDTLRADHLSVYGYPLETSPNLEELAEGATAFPSCISPANWTPPGHACIFTGRFPASHGAHKVKVDGGPDIPTCLPLPQTETTMAELLAEQGYRTAAVVANFGFVSPEFGLDQGFDFWFSSPPRTLKPVLLAVGVRLGLVSPFSCLKDPVPYRRADAIRRAAVDWVRRWGDDPFFLFINFMDPHSPYAPPGRWRQKLGGAPDGAGVQGFLDGLRGGTLSFGPEQWAQLRAQYDGEIAFVDSEVGELLDALKAMGKYDDSMIVVTSDHGEYLGEFGLVDHQVGLYQPVIHVPLIVKPAAGARPPAGADRVVQTVDILPTVLESLGLEVPDGLDGASLLSDERHPIIAEHYADTHVADWFAGRFSVNQAALLRAPRKLILASDGSVELFDLDRDPGEQHDLADRDPEATRELVDELEAWRDAAAANGAPDAALPELDDATIRRLRLLGYIK